MLKTTERKRRQAICASLIASTIVTVDCVGEDCACAIGYDPDTPPPGDDDSIGFAEIPSGDKVMYTLDPVITSLPVDPKIAVANIPADLAIEDVLVDAVSQPDQLVELDDAADDEVSPRLTRAKMRSASNQNLSSRRASRDSDKGLPDIITEEVIALPDTEHFGADVEVSEPDEHPMATRPVLQDNYVAFGVNGR